MYVGYFGVAESMTIIRRLSRAWNDARYFQLSKGVAKPYGECTEQWHKVLLQEGYFSQCGQDKLLAERILPGLSNGVFLEIGAHDGVTYSNTLHLERDCGWAGLAVEPLPHVFESLQANRRCHCVNACVGKEDGSARFRVVTGYAEMLSGLVGEYDDRHLSRIDQELKSHGGESYEIEVPCLRISSMLERYDIKKVDYLSIDVEGGEYEILKGIDFSRLSISVIGVENNYKDYRIPDYLRRSGYVFHSIVGDEIYVQRDVLQGGARHAKAHG